MDKNFIPDVQHIRHKYTQKSPIKQNIQKATRAIHKKLTTKHCSSSAQKR